MKSKLGQLINVVNTERKFGSNQDYYVVHVNFCGENKTLLMTEKEVNTAIDRAKENKEDVPKLKRPWYSFLWL